MSFLFINSFPGFRIRELSPRIRYLLLPVSKKFRAFTIFGIGGWIQKISSFQGLENAFIISPLPLSLPLLRLLP
ncbi:MAG: hypothetical protein EZS28_016329 [Streblomastix strix]|uniref:Uncharacterized protein n=1 Tax=Streblomastix strix TaxID=222440 RepID=A0A5J4VZN8_9EUKA|nr:MAG: hypothetical protein EZS28_016329 [Streblomastix strix]